MQTWQKLKKNPDLWKQYLVREKVHDGVRNFFKKRNFREVQTPLMVPIPSCEPNLEVFETKLKTSQGQERRAFLSMSPEYSIKKLLAAGLGNCFEITRAFRNNEEISPQHNPEFTILEWYRIGANYKDIMIDFEEMFIELLQITQPQVKKQYWEYQGNRYDLSRPWIKIKVSEAFEQWAKIDKKTLLSEAGLRAAAEVKGYNINAKTSGEQIFYQILFNEIEPELKQLKKPIFLYDYPLALASLSRKKNNDPKIAERFEVYLAGLELGNCFSELTNPDEQEARFWQELKERQELKKNDYPLDKELIKALRSGMPDTAGIAVGVDRLVMLMANVETVAETMFFPGKELFDLE